MNLGTAINEYITIADTQAKRLTQALAAVEQLLPLDPKRYNALTAEEAAYLDMLSTRFCKLQDIIGAKLFPLILKKLKEDNLPAFIDKVNKLEKLGFIESAEWWFNLRESRNEITHDDPSQISELIHALNSFPKHGHDLLDFWPKLKTNIAKLS